MMNQNTVENSPSWYPSNEKTTSQHHNSNNYVSHTHSFPSSTTTTHNNHSHTNNNNGNNTAVATTTTATALPQPPASDDNNDRAGMMAKTDTPHIPNAYSVQQGPESPQQHAAFVLNPNNSNNVQEDVIPANYNSPNPQSFSNNHFAILNNNSSDPTASVQSAAAAVSNNNYSDNNSNSQFSGSLQQRQLLGLTPIQAAAQQPHHLQHRNSQTLSLPMMSYNVASSVIAIRERKQKAAAAEGGDDDVITGAPTAAPPMPLTYKTTYCRSYLRGKVCSFGFGCMFAHNESELRTMAMNIADGLHTFEAMNAYRNGAAVARNNTGGVPPVPGVTTLPQLAAALSRRATEGANAYNASATIQGTPNNAQLAGYPSSYAYTGSPLLGTNYSTPFVNALPVMATPQTPNTSHQSVHQLLEHQGLQPASFQQQHAMQAPYFNPQLPQPHAVAYGNPVPSMAGPATTAPHGHMLNHSTASSSNGSLFKRDANASQGRVGIVTSLPPGYSQSPSATTANLSNASSQQAIFQYYYGQNQFPSVDAFAGLANNNGTSAPSSNPLHATSTVGTSYTGPQLGVSVTGLGDSSRGQGPLPSFNNVSAANSSLQPLLGTPLGGIGVSGSMGAQQLPSTSSPPAASVSIPSLGYRRQHSLSAENVSLAVGSNSSPMQQSMTTYTTARAAESQLGTSLPHQPSFAIVTNAATVSENSTPASASVGPPPASHNTPLRQGAMIGATVVSRGAAPPPTYGAQQQQQMLSQPNTAAMAHYYQQTAMQQQQQQQQLQAHQQQQLQLQQQQQQQMLYLYSNSASQGNGVVTMLPTGHQQHQQQRATAAPHQFYGQQSSVSDANQTSAESQAMLQHLMRAMAIQQPQQGAHAQPQYYYPNQQQ